MKNSASPYTFIDLFAGIGGTRIAFEKVNCKCVFSSEWDKYAQMTYETNFKEKPVGDIRKIKSKDIPKHDILVAGFPCQPFSISGVSKKKSLGRPHGFDDKKQGNLFFEIKRILKNCRPDAFLLENVKNLKSHDKGRTFEIIMQILNVELGYNVFYKILDASNYVPQHRERIFIVGFKNFKDFKFPIYNPPKKIVLNDILEDDVADNFTLSDHLWNYLKQYAAKHRAKGNGFGYGLTSLENHTRTLSARYYKDGSEILIPQKRNNPRRLTPRECARLMGFPDDFKIEVSNTQAYKQFGNSVVVPLVYDIARSIIGSLSGRDLFHDKKHYKFISGDKYEPTLFDIYETVSC